MKKDKLKAFVKKHGTKIAAGTGIVIGVAFLAITRKTNVFNEVTAMSTKNGIRNIPIPDDFGVGRLTDLFEDCEEIVAIARKLTVNDLGKFGEEIVKHGIIADGAEACVMLETLK